MKKRLEESRQEKIAERYREHPLLIACCAAFTDYQAGMNYLLFSPVEVFVETIDVIDDLFDETIDNEVYINGLWNNLTIKYKLWLPGTPNDEVQTAVCSVFYTVAVALSVCDESYYRETLKQALLDIIYEHKSVVKQEEDTVIVHLAANANELKTWMDEYVQSDIYLSDEIESCQIRRKSNSAKKEKPKEVIMTSFNYQPKGIDTSNRNFRLEGVFELMMKKDVELIPINTNKKDFLAIFSGEETIVRVPWIGYVNELHYIISEWIKRKYLPRPKGGIWVVANARFFQRKKKEDSTYEDKDFGEDALRKTGNPENPSDSLEQIIEMLKPDVRVRRFNE